MTAPCPATAAPLPGRFVDPETTATGETRGRVPFDALRTLWLNTGTLCNIACQGCYIESSPRNDRLVYLSASEAARFLDEAGRDHPTLREIGVTGGEPFLNRDTPAIVGDALRRGYRVLVLTNAMRPMQRAADQLRALHAAHPGSLAIRVSLDHWDPASHERVRGPGTWAPAMAGVRWLAASGFDLAIAGRRAGSDSEASLRDGYRALFRTLGLAVDADDPRRLVLFPEIGDGAPVPEITERCWEILGRSPSSVMCADSRMVVHRSGADAASVVSCTLLPYDAQFDLGPTIAASVRHPVRLNHPVCARFCVLGGASCSAG